MSEFGRQCAAQPLRNVERHDAQRGSACEDSSPARYRSRRIPVEGGISPEEGVPGRPENFAICDEACVRLIGYDGSGIAWMRRLSEDVEQ